MDRKRLGVLLGGAREGRRISDEDALAVLEFAYRAHVEASFALEIAEGAGPDAVGLVHKALTDALKRAVGR